MWSYPREDFALDQTGLAAVAPDRRAGRRTANGELHDPARATAGHRTLQLPAIVRVMNLENGREMLLRVNDRGPSSPGRVLKLSRRAAELLGVPPSGTAQLRVTVDPELSRAAADRAAGRQVEALPIAAAPRAAVSVEPLNPPGARDRATSGGPSGQGDASQDAIAGLPEVTLPEQVTQGVPRPGQLFVQAGYFYRRDAAAQQAARLVSLGARVEAFGPLHDQQFRVRIGPFQNAADADRALERTLASGVSEARIIVD